MARRSPTTRYATTTHGKLTAPRLAQVFARDRLFATLDTFAGKPLVWLASAPGSGKTTLVASYLAARDRTSVWMLLDRADSDPATFFHFATLGASVAGKRRRVRLPTATVEDLRDLPGFARRYFRLLATSFEAPWVLVLDNYQEIVDESGIHEVLRVVATELPEGAQIIVISRSLPPPAMMSALAAQQLALIDASALRFTLDETRSLLDLHGRVELAQQLLKATDGWAAGLILMLASEASVSAIPPADNERSHALVFDYFAGEVLQRMPARDQQILMRVALLPSMTDAMAIAISAAPTAPSTLAELYRRNLFIDRRGNSEPTYVFHALFREFLLTRASRSFSIEEMRSLKRLAARLLAEHGQIDGAMHHLLEATAWDDAQLLLREHAAQYFEQGRTQSLREWIDALPVEHRERPILLYWRAYCDMAMDPATTLPLFDRAYEGFVALDDQIGQLLAAAGASEAIVLRRAGQAALDRWVRVFEALAARFFEIRDPRTELRVLPGMLAAFVAREAHHQLTSVLADRAEQLLESEPAATQRILFGAVATCFLDMGQHERLTQIVARIDRLRDAPHIAPITAIRWRQVEVVWKLLVGRLEEAKADADDALRLAETPGLERFRGPANVAAAGAAWGNEDVPRAREHLELARSLISPTRLLERRAIEHYSGGVALRAGDPEAAVRHFRRAAEIAHKAGSPGSERVMLFNLCLALTETGEFAGAEIALRDARSHPSYGVSPFHQWVITTIEANLADRIGDRPRCVAALTRAFAIARENNYSYAPGLFANGIMPRICAIALEHGIDMQFVRRIVRQRRLTAPKEATAAWPWPIRIRTLGRFQIERDDAPLPLTRKEQRKPLELLRLIIALGRTGVNARQLAHLLWPEADGDAARNSFDNALHRLRKLLGGERALTLQDGALSLDAGTCWVDIQALEASIDGVEAALRDREPHAHFDSLAQRLLALNEGSFLDGDESYPSIIATRQRLRSRLHRALSAVAVRYESRNDWDHAADFYERILEQDVLAEDIYRRVILCRLKQGRRAEAFETYRRCRDNLSIILGLRPSVETEALAAMLRNA